MQMERFGSRRAPNWKNPAIGSFDGAGHSEPALIFYKLLPTGLDISFSSFCGD